LQVVGSKALSLFKQWQSSNDGLRIAAQAMLPETNRSAG
jgi:hypothetical protein